MSTPLSSVPFASSSLSSLPTYSSSSKSRLQSLYSDFSRQKHSNPTSYNSNVEWWQRTLETLVSRGCQFGDIDTKAMSLNKDDDERETNKLVLNAERSLVEILRYEGVGKPLGLGAVIAELRGTKALIPLPQFLTSTQSVYDSGWLPYRIVSYIVGKPLWWALEQLELVQSEDHYSESEMWKRVTGKYVVLSLVEKAADAVMRIREADGTGGAADDLYSFESFKKKFAGAASTASPLSRTDVKVLVKYLERERKILVVDKEVIKFVDANQNREVTVVDRGILELKTAVENLHAQIANVQRKINDCTEKINTALQQKRRPAALSYLKSKKQLEDLLIKRLGSLEMLQSTFIRVQAAAEDVEIIKSYESSTVTLRAILAHPSLQRDKIDETMDAMASASADAREVDEAIKIGGDMATAEAGIDESELEKELQALVIESEKEKEREDQRINRLAEECMKVPEGMPEAKHAQEATEDSTQSGLVTTT